MRRIEDMGINELLGLIRLEPQGARRERLLAAALSELIEVEIDWRTGLRHQNVGYHKVSTIGGMGEGRGELTGTVDHVGQAAERYRYACRWRTMSKALLAHVSERQQMALLLTGYAIQPVGGCQSPRMMTLAQVVERQVELLQRLGWAPMAGYGVALHVPFKHTTWRLKPVRFDAKAQRKRLAVLKPPGEQRPFRSVVALRDTARRARAALLNVVADQARIAA
ncbi:hypothetical protein SAMN05661010_02534 [Modicisalibacter muralis]|uniref:Uncharacterized protein n=1 Tax=Modicisalibacter muralis TaxID=119000 RepID=A0A1G9MV11_9GAMM|nr:hypothetical protein [Halomonas muralis]SDL78136.1 hypothetical protein SAMN05661010_02534 [Halomonas muralis]